jgi:formylglycine-generating enzyme required for sulfatase activity
MARDERSDHLFIPGYEILRPIGRGGMGDVFLARQLSLGRLVALKLLSISPGTDAAERSARFRREAELMARVHHPNIVSVHDFGSVDGRPYLVMEYVEGGDLRRQMVPGRAMPVHQVRPLVSPVTQALACLHAHGILHRDLKPENILMHHEVTPMLSDFGLAVLDSDAGVLTQADQALGTLGYVAPEQQYRLGVDERTDQYSMAALLYELLTGHRPLGILKPPSRLNPALGPDVDAVLLRALQEDPDDRYPTVQEFGETLERALSLPATRPRLRPTRAGLVAAVSVAGAVGLWVMLGRPFFMWGDPVGHGNGQGVRAPRTIAPDPAPGRPPSPVVTPGPAADAPPARLTNSLGMSLGLAPPGRFVMGASRSDDLAGDHERPEHPVRISRPFYMGVTEVTVGQFRDFVVATGYRTEAETTGRGGVVHNPKKKVMVHDPQCDWRSPGLPRPQGDDEPVVQVSWNDAMAFFRWLSDLEHRTNRLPTEDERQ